jgi:hypothetical protein
VSQHTDQPTKTTLSSSTAGNTASDLPLTVAQMTALLQEVNKLFPPIEGKLADGRTREGKQQRAYIAQRDAYIAALTAGITHGTTENRLRQEMDLIIAGHETDTASYAEQIKNLKRYMEMSGSFMVIAFQIGLLMQRRPETVRVNSTYGLTVDFNIGDLAVNVWPNQQKVKLTAPGMKSRLFDYDDEGNFLIDNVERLVGYLTMAGYTIRPEHVKQAISAANRRNLFTDPASAKANAMTSAIGRIAMQGAGLGWNVEPSGSMHDPSLDVYGVMLGEDPVTLARSKPSAVSAMTEALRRQYGDNLGVNLRKQSPSGGIDTDFIVIITDGMSHPGNQKG